MSTGSAFSSLPPDPYPHVYTQVEDWKRSEDYHNSFLIKPDEDPTSALKRSEENQLPNIAVSPTQGKFLYLLALSLGAKRILEVGTLAGYSTIWLAKALPEDGEIITLEVSEKHAKVAQDNLVEAGLSSKVKIIVDQATSALANLDGPFDLVFIDADKPNNTNYFREAERVTKRGGVIIVDNVVRHGIIANPEVKDGDDASCDGVRELLKYVRDSKRVSATTLASVDSKGYDGYLYAGMVMLFFAFSSPLYQNLPHC